jgi:hypothetical protein
MLRSFELVQVASIQMSRNMARCLSVFDKENDFVPKHRYGKTAPIIQTMCVPIRTLSMIRQVVRTKFNRPDVSLHGSEAQALLWKLHAAEMKPS